MTRLVFNQQTQVWDTFPDLPEIVVIVTESDIRMQRDVLLLSSDWTQLIDSQVDQAAWAVYRQSLRDLPGQEGFPENVVWPATLY